MPRLDLDSLAPDAMIDLHCHILPGIDDGAPTLGVSLAMARRAVEDGIAVSACTPHIYPGLYHNDRRGILRAMHTLRGELVKAGIPLQLVVGADTHLAPRLSDDIARGKVPTLNDTRYLLLEPPHHVAPPRFDESVFQLMADGYVPVITHPERLSWIEQHYEVFQRLVHAGAWMQVTGGALVGRFGARPKYWAERMLDESLVHILATDSHHIDRRPPQLAEARDAAAARLGDSEALNLVCVRPRGIVANTAPELLPPLADARPPPRAAGFWQRLWGGA